MPEAGHRLESREAIAGSLLGTGSNLGFHPRMRFSSLKEVTVPMPARLASLRFPKALDDRLHHLLDEQGRRGSLVAAERREAEALVNIATTLSILKLGAQVKALKSRREWQFP